MFLWLFCGKGAARCTQSRGLVEKDACVLMAVRSSRSAAMTQVQQLRQRERRRHRRSQALLVVLPLVVVLGLAAGAAFVVRSPSAPTSASGGVQSFTAQRDHVPGAVAYAQTPPAGGKHSATWLNCGIYTQPVPNENAVHDLEHGAVWITYRPGLPAADIARLTALATGQSYLTLSPYPGLPAPVVVSAWGKQLRLTSARDAKLAGFISTYRQSPNAPEPGAPCTGGVGSPAGVR